MHAPPDRMRHRFAALLPRWVRPGYCLRAPHRWLKRALTDQITISRYLDAHRIRKLQIGAGMNTKEGWLNGDIDPVGRGVIYLDAAKRFPFEDGVFHYVFSEHMIEHVTYTAGRNMLSECYRVLVPGGQIRICTPDLTNFLRLFRPDRSQIEDDYMAWATREFIAYAETADPVFVLNNYVRDWGHQFIYDQRILTQALQRAGFVDVTRHALGESGDAALRDLEYVDRMPPGFLELESMVLEAVKPRQTG